MGITLIVEPGSYCSDMALFFMFFIFLIILSLGLNEGVPAKARISPV